MNERPGADDNSADFILSLPKAELHLHLEGSVDPETLSELSRRHNTPLPTTNTRYQNIEDSGRVLSVEEARALYDYRDFTGFLLAFKAVTERLRTAEDYELITYRLMRKAGGAARAACRGLRFGGSHLLARAAVRSAL